MRKQLDKNLSFHKLVAYMIALMTGELKGDHSTMTRVEYFRKSDSNMLTHTLLKHSSVCHVLHHSFFNHSFNLSVLRLSDLPAYQINEVMATRQSK